MGVLTAAAILAFAGLAAAGQSTDPGVETPTTQRTQEGDTVPEIDAKEADKEVEQLEADIAANRAQVEKVEGFVEIEAAPIGEGEPTIAGAVELTEGDEAKEAKPFGITIVMDHAFGSGNFVSDATLRERADYVAQAWSIKPTYTFDIPGDHTLVASAALAFVIELTRPDKVPSRRFNPTDLSLGLTDPAVFEEPFFGISFSAGLGITLPTSYESINVNRRWFATRLSLGASRILGPVTLTYGFGFTKHFNSSKVTSSYTELARLSDNILSEADNVIRLERGFGNTNVGLSNSFALAYAITESLSVGLSVGIANGFRYNVASCAGGEPDPYTSPYADCDAGRSDMLSESLSASYKLDDLIEKLVALPFSLTVASGITAAHPAQSADNQTILWPWFYPALANDRAANNYGSIYVDLMGAY